MLDSCVQPELAAEITLQPIRRLDVDAAVLFSDIVVPLFLAGVDVEIAPGVGPVINKPIRSAADVAELPDLDPAALAPVSEAISLIVEELGFDQIHEAFDSQGAQRWGEFHSEVSSGGLALD